jgi:predicted RNA methylase
MSESKEVNLTAIILERIRSQATAENIRVTQHAQQEMVEEDARSMRFFRLSARRKF